MPHLIAAVVVVGLLCVLDLVLTYGVIRRLREHTELLSPRLGGMPDLILGPGSTVGSFAAMTVEGDVFTGDELLAGTLVGFFSPGCGACVDALPKFVGAAAAHPGGRDRVLAVMIGSEEDCTEQIQALSARARVVVTQHGHEIETAFEVKGFPGFALIGEDRVVKASGGIEAVVPSGAVA